MHSIEIFVISAAIAIDIIPPAIQEYKTLSIVLVSGINHKIGDITMTHALVLINSTMFEESGLEMAISTLLCSCPTCSMIRITINKLIMLLGIS
ncbi:hypothetical protein D3C73_1210960 [compost metagenome]